MKKTCVSLCVCVCVHVYAAGRDVWLASEFQLYEDSIAWILPCPSSYLKPSAALCWRNDTGLCTPILNSRLEMINSLVSGVTEVKELVRMMDVSWDLFFCVIPFSWLSWPWLIAVLLPFLLNSIATTYRLWTSTLKCVYRWACVCVHGCIDIYMDDVLAFGSYVNLLERQ